MKIRNSFFLFVLLLFFSACGKETSGSEQLFFASHDVYKQKDYSEEDRPLKNLQYLLTQESLYVVGTYSTAVEEETEGGYVTRMEDALFLHCVDPATKESKLMAEYPAETLLAMCEGDAGGLVFATARWMVPEDGSLEMEAEYVLRVMDAESGECEEYSLNTMLDNIADFGYFSAMAVRGDELAIADIRAKTLCILNYNEGRVKQAVPIEGYTDYMEFGDDSDIYAGWRYALHWSRRSHICLRYSYEGNGKAVRYRNLRYFGRRRIADLASL